MILITGATGFVGRRLVRRIVQESHFAVRVLLRPGSDTSNLPSDISVQVMIASLIDTEQLNAALDGVHTIIHLVGTDTRGRHTQLEEVDIAGTRALIEAAMDARVGRIIYVSRVGADRGSAFETLRTKGEVEHLIRESGLAYTIFQVGVLFGEGDKFTEHIAMLSRTFPVFLLPGDGEMTIQPLWVEDLVSCLLLSLENLDMLDFVIALGGPEILTLRRIVMRVMHASKSRRPLITIPLLVHRAFAWYLDGLFARWPVTEHWVDMLSASPTAELGEIERVFGFRPTSCDLGIFQTYMTGRWYFLELVAYIFSTYW